MSGIKAILLGSAMSLSCCPVFAFSMLPRANPASNAIRIVCAEGSPNCRQLDYGHIKAAKQVQDDLMNNGEHDCKGGGICGNAASGGAASAAKGARGRILPMPGTSNRSGKH